MVWVLAAPEVEDEMSVRRVEVIWVPETSDGGGDRKGIHGFWAVELSGGADDEYGALKEESCVENPAYHAMGNPVAQAGSASH